MFRAALLVVSVVSVVACGGSDTTVVTERPEAVSQPVWDSWQRLTDKMRSDTCRDANGDTFEATAGEVAATFDLTALEAVVFLAEVCD